MIYLDNASTTKPLKVALEINNYFAEEMFFNPSALYSGASKVSVLLNDARGSIAKLINCDSKNVFFTSCGTESDNMAIFGTVKNKNDKIICSEYEHSAVYNCFLKLKNEGFNVEFVKISKDGLVDLNHLESIVDEKTKLVSIIHVSNEFGGVNDLKEINKIIRKKNPDVVFHSDGVQAFGKVPVNVKDFGVDLYSISGHKINAPKGTGVIFVKAPNKLKPLIVGGGQESGMRSGTENVSSFVAIAKCAEITISEMQERSLRYLKFKDYIIEKVVELGDVKVNTIPNSANHILSLSISGVRGEVVVHSLETKEIFIGVGSACSSKNRTSRVHNSIGLNKEQTEGTIRISFGHENTFEEIKLFTNELIETVKMLRNFKRK